MNPYVARLKAYLAEKVPDYEFADGQSLLEMLHYYYTCANPIDSGLIRCQLGEVDKYLKKLPMEDADQIFAVVSGLCAEYEKKAFIAGIQVGTRLIHELGT